MNEGLRHMERPPSTRRYAAVVGRGSTGCGGRLPIGVTLLGVGVGRFDDVTSWSSSWYALRCSTWQLATAATSRFSSSARARTWRVRACISRVGRGRAQG